MARRQGELYKVEAEHVERVRRHQTRAIRRKVFKLLTVKRVSSAIAGVERFTGKCA